MKVSKETYKRIRDDMEQVINRRCSRSMVASGLVGGVNKPSVIAHSLWSQICYDRMNNDNHPAFSEHGRQRVLQYQPDFDMYPDDTNDKTLGTALVKALLSILKEDMEHAKSTNNQF